jgi:hypothetical protein
MGEHPNDGIKIADGRQTETDVGIFVQAVVSFGARAILWVEFLGYPSCGFLREFQFAFSSFSIQGHSSE